MDERYVVPARVLAGGCAPVSGICLVCGLSSRCQPLEKCYRAVAPLEPENAESILATCGRFTQTLTCVRFTTYKMDPDPPPAVSWSDYEGISASELAKALESDASRGTVR